MPKVTLPPFKTVRLENGLTLFLLERHQLPMISFHWLMKSGGSVGDPPNHEGLASLTANLLRKGTKTRTADQISVDLDFVGATFDAGASLEYSVGSAEFVKKDLDQVLDLVADMLLAPSFPPEEVDKLIHQGVDGIKEAKEVPGAVMERYYESFLFGTHPYGRPSRGTETSLPQITRQEVVEFFDGHYAPNEMLFAAAGDFSASELETKLRARFGVWKAKSLVQTPITPPKAKVGRHAEVIEKPDATQTFFRFGNIGLARPSEDWIPAEVVNTVFGGRFTSMLNTELRIESGLTYGANSFFTAHKQPGAFVLASYTPNEKTAQAMDIAVGVLKKLHEKGLSAEQLESAKSYIKGQFGPTLETNAQLANTLCELEFYGLGREYIDSFFQRIDAVSMVDAKRIIATYYPLENLDYVFIGQSKVIEPVAGKLSNEIKKKAITEPGF